MPAADVTFNATWERARYNVKLNTPKKYGSTSTANGSQQAYDKCYVTATINGKVINGSTPSGTLASTAVNVGDIINIGLVSDPAENTQDGGTTKMVIQNAVAIQKTTNQNIMQLNSSEQGSTYSFTMPPDEVTVTLTVSPSFTPA